MAYQHAVVAAQNTLFILTQRTERNRIVQLHLFHVLESVRQQYARFAWGFSPSFFDWFIFRKYLQDFTFIGQVLLSY
jgi:hypothetical protein